MAGAGPRKTNRYGEEFKATVVKLSSLPGVLIQDVAAVCWTCTRSAQPCIAAEGGLARRVPVGTPARARRAMDGPSGEPD
ncbi:MAG: hypothetical protein L0Z68_06055 [Gammaproteobacteria bacterium]|nr:hypothetical protein [Gammaproteobacteria bacterium]